MANLKGTVISSSIVPFSSDDIFETHRAEFGRGSFRTVQNINERDEIKELRRENLMMVAVESNSSSGSSGDTYGIEVYQLILNNSDNPLSDDNLMNNDNFVPVNFGGGGDWVFPPPATSVSSGKFGERSFDANFVYICIEDNLWKRMAMDFFVLSDPNNGLNGTNFDLPLGSVPYWDGNDWDNTIVVKDVSDEGTSGIKVTYSNDVEVLLPIFSNGTSNINGDNWTLPPPISSFSSGSEGQRSYDEKFLYICVEDNLWKRINLDFFIFDSNNTTGISNSSSGTINDGSVPVWDGNQWDTKRVVCDIIPVSGTNSTSGDGLEITYTDDTTSIINLLTGDGTPTDITYIRQDPTVIAVGGIPSGTVPNYNSVQDLFDQMFYPFQEPSVSISGGTLHEKGLNVFGNYPYSINLRDGDPSNRSINLNGVLVENPSTNNGTYVQQTALTWQNSPNNASTYYRQQLQYNVSFTNTTNKQNVTNIEFASPTYYGVLDITDVNETNIKTLNKRIRRRANDNNLSFSPTLQRYVYAYPESYGDLNQIIDPNGFNVTASFNKSVIGFTLVDSTTENYNIYVSDIDTTQTNFLIDFQF